MTNKELKRLSRRDLIDIIYEMKKNELELRAQLDEAQEKLRKRQIVLETTGSIADAALALNGVFAAAQAAADDYLRSVKAMHTDLDEVLAETKELLDEG